ncbi:coiled-coil domain-containing protein [Xanthobacter agilis]|uniref:hypothetical protein n=1 Tax=Xanthobacter agilis TaxID=47492 RepID=UPI0037270C7A
MNDLERIATLAALQVRLAPRPDRRPNLPSPRIMDALGGVCRAILLVAAMPSALTPSQKELDNVAARKRLERDDTGDRDCVLQLLLFETAYADPLATDAQLSGLARDIRRRFRAVLVSAANANDPAVQDGLRQFSPILARISRLQGAGVALPASLFKLLDIPEGEGFAVFARGWIGSERIAPIERQLTALEDEAAQPLRAAKIAEEARLAQELAAQRAQNEQEAARKRAELERAEAEQARARAERARKDRIESLQSAIARANEDLESEYTIARISHDRPPYSRDRQASIDRILARRGQLEAKLRDLQGVSVAPPPPLPVIAAAPAATEQPAAGSCRIGAPCPVIELTLFCRTRQQLNAVLSQRPGRDRKQVLSTLTASGDCRQVRAGEAFSWADPIIVIQPQGEEAAELAPGTLADGSSGFLLKDGILPRTDAAR